MIPTSERFDLLKQQVSIPTLLASFGLLERFHEQAGKLRGPCPLHGGDRRDSFVVDPERGLWHCFSGCQRGGDLVELARLLTGGSYRETAQLLSRIASHPTPGTPLVMPSEPKPEQRPFSPFTRVLLLDPYAPFIQSKGIRPELARALSVGQFHGRGFLERCIGVRLHDPQGRPLGYLGRRLAPEEIARFGKWKCPPGLPKGSILYLWHHRGRPGTEHLVVVECPWAVLRLVALGIPAAALLGVHATRTQLALLASVPKLTLLFDGDPAGREGAARLATRLKGTSQTRIVQVPDGLDPDDLDDQVLRSLVETRT